MISEADRRVIERLYGPLVRFAAAVHPPGLDPDDLVQDAFVRVLDRGGLSGVGSPMAYLRRTIVNLASNHRRRFDRHVWAMVTLRGPGDLRDRYSSELADLMRLPPRARAVLYLSAVEGLSYSEIADIVGGSEDSARMAASRARRRLAAAVAREV